MSETVVNIKFEPSAKQYEAWELLMDDHTEFIGYGGSGFSGKTWLMCYWLTTMCVTYPDTGWGLGRKELVNLKRTSLLTLFKVFKECGITEKAYTYNQQLNTITFWNGSQIFLIDTAYKPSDPLYQRFGGYELTGVAIDESAESDWEAINILYTRTNRRNNALYGLKRKVLETFNPAKNHVHSRYYTPYKTGTLKKSYAFVKALPKDNPSPEVEEYISGIMENSDKITIQRLVFGDFDYDDDDNALIGFDSITNVFDVLPKMEIVREEDATTVLPALPNRYMTVDPARFGKDKSVLMVWDGLTVIKIFTIDRGPIDELVRKAKELQIEYRVPLNQIIADSDGVGGGFVDYMKCKGFINNGKPLRGENYQNIKTQCYYRLAKEVNSGTVKVTPTDKRLEITAELEQVKRYNADKDGKLQMVPKDIVKKILGRSPDYSDNMMLRMWYEVKYRSKVRDETKKRYAII